MEQDSPDKTEQDKEPAENYCLNCGTKLTGNYCSHCGQKKQHRRQTLGELIGDFVSSFTSFESKFFHTLKILLFKPGVLPMEYIEGKRARYYHPVRAYAFISAVFFVALFSLPQNKNNIVNVRGMPNDQKSDSSLQALTQMDSANYDTLLNAVNEVKNGLHQSGINTRDSGNASRNITLDPRVFFGKGRHYKDLNEYEAVQDTLPVDQKDGWFMRKINRKGLEIKSKYKNNMPAFIQDFGKSFFSNFPKIFFILLPVFALILKFLYIRRDFYYSEHLVFSIYFYDFFFLGGTIVMLLDRLPGMDWIQLIFSLYILLYLLLAMKRMYKQGWIKTFSKFSILGILFLISVGVVMAANLVITFVLI